MAANEKARLTDIARQLKATFVEDFGAVEHLEETARYKHDYQDAECINIDSMDYIVINQVYDVYKLQEFTNFPSNTSPYFYNSINNTYAVIDAETSSTLIDEVYSRVTYMQRVCRIDADPEPTHVHLTLRHLLGDREDVTARVLAEDNTDSRANIFQCQLIMDTGVSAVPDVYNFMLKGGEIKEIPDHVMSQIRKSGEVNLFRDHEVLERNKLAIQEAVFDKYVNSELDVQSVSVKSIFEIVMTFRNIQLAFEDKENNRIGVYHTSYIASEKNEFDDLNANLHKCNECNRELVDIKDGNIFHLHINMDALDQELDTEEKRVHAIGCEDCLVECPCCHGWHFNYEKFIGSQKYAKVKFAPGRSFIKGLRSVEGNYCTCREGIEWVYDERTSAEDEHDIIPIEQMAFVNYANEMIASYDDYRSYCERKRRKEPNNAVEEMQQAAQMRRDFKKHLASQYDIDVKDINITNASKCLTCDVCEGTYYREAAALEMDQEYRCPVCTELISENHHTVTRIDGIVFMRQKAKGATVINKYVVTKFGNLKKIASSVYSERPPEEEEAEEGLLSEHADTDSTPAADTEAAVQ